MYTMNLLRNVPIDYVLKKKSGKKFQKLGKIQDTLKSLQEMTLMNYIFTQYI
jgi:hypothetical protein